MAFLVGRRDLALGPHRHAVRHPEAPADDLEILAGRIELHDHTVMVDPGRECVARRLGEVEVAVTIPIEIEGELVKVVCGEEVVVEVLIEVRFAIVVEVVQPRDLVAVQHVYGAVHDLGALGLVEPGGVAPPDELIEIGVHSVDDPDVAAPGGDHGAVFPLEEREVSGAHPRFPGVVGGQGDLVDDVGARGRTETPASRHRLRKARGSAPGEARQGRRRGRLPKHRGQAFRLGSGRQEKRPPACFVGGREAQTDLLEAQTALENILVANTDLHEAEQALADAEYALIDYKADRDYYNYNNASWDAVEKAREEYYAKKQIVWQKESAYEALSHLEADDPVRLAAYEERKAAIQEADKYLHYLSNLLGTYYDHYVETDFIEYDQALAVLEEARIAYNRYLDQTEEITAAEANVQALQNTINQAKIIAPFAGTVTEVSAVSGELVSSGTEAVRIDNLDNLMVDVDVSEIDINSVEVGQFAILTFDALANQEYSGFVESISSAGTDESGVVEFRVSVKVEDADEAVRPGFTSVVGIITSEVEDALLVPTQAILTQGGVPVVMRVNSDGSATAVPVELGAISDVYTQVISGDIAVGDQLAVTLASSTDAEDFDPSMMRKIVPSGDGGGGK